MARPIMALGRRYLVDQREYEIMTRGNVRIRARFDRDRLWFREDNRGPVTLIDEVTMLRETDPLSKGREGRAWTRLDDWFLQPRTKKTRGVLVGAP